MERLPKSRRYYQPLMDMVATIAFNYHLKEEEAVLIVLELTTDEMVQKWFDWIKARLIGENEIDATATEIVRAAVQIDQGIL